MRLEVRHLTRYQYSQSVFLEPHYLSFYPQQRPFFQLVDFELEVNPAPVGIFSLVNENDFQQHQCWFSDLHDELSIRVRLVVDTKSFNPFNFFLDQNKNAIPPDHPALKIPGSISKDLSDYIESYRSPVVSNITSGISLLLSHIHENWEHSVRYEEDIHPPSECFALGSGSCRDIAWMLITVLRYLGIPARFVSGYAFNPELGEGHELHAWVEFFAPGAGWLGVDPSAGIFTTETYLPTAVSCIPKDTLPVVGTFRGDASATLSTKVDIKAT